MTISAASTDFLAAHALHVVLVLSFLTARVWLQTGHSTIFVHGGRAARGLFIESLTRGDLMKCLETGGQTGLSGAPYPSSSILSATYAATAIISICGSFCVIVLSHCSGRHTDSRHMGAGACRSRLASAGINRAELGRRLGITPRQISRWANSPPKYAIAYLELLAESKKPRSD